MREEGGGDEAASGRERVWRAVVVMTGTAELALAAETFTTDIVGREEVPAVSTVGRGFFVGTLNDAETSLSL